MRPTFLFLAAAATALTAVANAAPAAAQASTQAKVNGRVAVEAVRRLLNDKYVLTELRPKFDAILAKGLAEGRYDVSDAEELVRRINADLAQVTPDKHLGVMYDPEQSRQLSAAPSGGGADDAPPTPEEVKAAERRNHGLVQMKILPGNVRYLESDGFVWAGEPSARAYDDAMRFLAGGDAAIIDLRRNGGGSPDAVRYMISHFIEANKPLMTFYMGNNRVDPSVSLATLRAPRMIGKPLYVLSSGNSASAAEEFIGHVAGYKLGEVIGDKSAGAGFRNEFFPLPEGLLISISVGRAVLASTGKDWEGVGIIPTTEVSAGKALEVAQVHALRKLAAAAKPADKKAIEAAATLLAAQIEPVKTALALDAYAGTYGERSVMIEDGKLTYQRAGGPKAKLIAVGPNEFAFEHDPALRLQFAVSGPSATGLELVRPDGTRAAAARTQ